MQTELILKVGTTLDVNADAVCGASGFRAFYRKGGNDDPDSGRRAK